MQGMAGSTPRVEVQVFIENLQRQVRTTGLLPETRQQLQEAFEAREAAAQQARDPQELGCLMDLANVVVRDLDDRVTRWTGGAEHLYGFTAEQAVGRLSHDLLQTQFPEPLEQIRQKLLGTGRWEGELVHLRADGQPIVVASQWALRRDAAGQPIAILEVNNPITERKRTEESLRKNVAFIRQIIDASPNLVFVKDEAGRFLAVNRAMAELYGTSVEALVDRFNRDVLCNPADDEKYSRVDQQVLQTRQPVTLEETHRCPDGSVLWFQTTKTPIRLMDGQMGVLGIAVNITHHKLTESALQQSEEHFRLIAETIPQLVWSARADAFIDYYNRRFLSYLGRTLEQMQGRTWVSTLHPEDAPQAREAWAKAVQAGANYEAEVRIRRGDGSYRRHVARALPLCDSEGHIRRWFGTCTDIEDLNRTQDLLRDSEELHRVLFTLTPSGVILSDPQNGSMLAFNEQAHQQLGYSREEFAKLRIIDVEAVENDEEIRAHIDRIMQSGGEEFETQHRTKSGALRHMLVRARRVNLGGQQRIMTLCHDITEPKRVEAERQRLLDRLRLQVERMPIACITNDRDFRITGWNPAAEHLFGFTAAEAIGKHPYGLYIPESAQPVVDERRRRLEHGDMQASGVNENITKDGRTLLCQWTNTPLFDERGEYAGRIAMVQDVTEQVHAQEALQQSKEAAEAANRSKDQFLAMLSHELRTPLTPVVMLAASLEIDPALPQSARNDMGTIRRNIEIEARLVDDLLDLSRFTSGKLNLQLRPVDVHEQLRAVAGIWHNSLANKRLSLQWDLQAREHWVSGDEARIQQVFWNLIGNAIKFTPEGGTIWLRSGNDASRELAVEVRDSGAGIKPEMLSRIFSAFEQGEKGRSKGGLGLGLAICKAIVDLHHGAISAQSEGEGRGATLKVELPTTSEWLAATPQPPVAQAQSSLRILLVEDHEDTGRILRRLLEAEGHVVEHVTSGQAALDAAAARSFDLLISDLGLPDISGLEVMRQLRDQHNLKGIAVSGYGTEADLQRSSEAGFGAHVTKPINMKELGLAIAHVVGQR